MEEISYLYEEEHFEASSRKEKQRLRHAEYEKKRKRAELHLERRRLRQMLDMDELDFSW